MSDGLRTISRILFKDLMYRNDGTNFQKIFEDIMKEKYGDSFIIVKPYGIYGDRKNDGYLIDNQTYFQVYGPENIEKSIEYAINKLNEDVEELFKKWPKAKKIVYVVNDKFKGSNPLICEKINKIQEAVNTLDDKMDVEVRLWGCREIEKVFLSLDQRKREDIIKTPYFNDSILEVIDYNDFNEIINYIMNLPYSLEDEKLFPPDYEKKIRVNDFSNEIANRLEQAHLNAKEIENYFENFDSTLEDKIRKRIITQYKKMMKNLSKELYSFSKNELYLLLLETLCPKKTRSCYFATESLIAYYFECCDIFDSPKDFVN